MYYFIYSSLMPTTLNSQVLKKRALLTYSILKGMTIDVGRIINEEIHTMVNAGVKTQSIRFTSLILELCYRAKVIPHRNLSEAVPACLPLSVLHLLHSLLPSQPREKGVSVH